MSPVGPYQVQGFATVPDMPQRESTLRLFLRRARRSVESRTGMVARRAGYEFRRRHFYEPFPDVEHFDERLWQWPHWPAAVDLNADAARALLLDLAPHIREFGRVGFPIVNGSYESVDAETLYAMLRRLRPKRVVELGSGASSYVIQHARIANAEDGADFTHTIYDPYPGWHPMGVTGGADIQPLAAERLDASVFDALGENDVLFVDTTHTVKTGGDVVHIMLDLLPRVPLGVYVHFHDIFLPFEYPRTWVVDERRAWAEQYLLEAFLSFNAAFEVVLPIHLLVREYPDLVREIVPSASSDVGTGAAAFWLRRV